MGGGGGFNIKYIYQSVGTRYTFHNLYYSLKSSDGEGRGIKGTLCIQFVIRPQIIKPDGPQALYDVQYTAETTASYK